MKFGQLIEYNVRNIFFLNGDGENGTGRLIPDPFLFFKNTFGKSNWSAHKFQYISMGVGLDIQ